MDRKCCEIILLVLVLMELLDTVSKKSFAHSTLAAVGLPMIQIQNDGDDYPELQEEVHLEDFFWTGSGDGPPDYLKRVHTGISKGKEVIVKTEMVVATVYVDGNNEIDIPICLDCYPGLSGGNGNGGGGGGAGVGGFGGFGAGGAWEIGREKGGVAKNYSSTDRRYWLLTVMSGFYALQDNPMLEEKLARLYRLAFTRQHTQHLGLNGAQQIFESEIQHDTTVNGEKDQQRKDTKVRDLASEIEILNSHSTALPKQLKPTSPINKNSELATSSEETVVFAVESSTTDEDTTTSTSLEADSALDTFSVYVTLKPWEFIQQAADEFEKLTQLASTHHHQPKLANFLVDRVSVVIHNITQISEEDLHNGVGFSGYEEDVNEKINERPVANQTELIYTVFVNDLPVLATAAATDMKLVTEVEVAEVIGKDVFLKAEPYLREPQATPLAPATRSGAVAFLDSIQNNPALVIVTSIAILLLLLLMIALLLIGRASRNKKITEENRNCNRNQSDLFVENQSIIAPPTSASSILHHHHHHHTDRSTVQSRDVGIQNFSFEKETAGHKMNRSAAHIHFPGPPPPTSNSRRDSATSSDNTSDSSIYCPLNLPSADAENVLDAKATALFENHQRRHDRRHDHHHHQYDRADTGDHEEPIYSSVAAEKKRDRTHYKAKRRYISENRVGSFDSSSSQRPQQQQQHYSGAEELSTDSNGDGDEIRPRYQNLKHAEAFNQHNNYQRNLLLHQQRLGQGVNDQKHTTTNTERHRTTTTSINRNIIKALQPSEKSSDSGSIGSFLSMASVKAFPKSALPEPLNRVLEPVFVTYYDNAEDSNPAAGKTTKSTKSSRKQRPLVNDLEATTIATVERFPIPSAPPKKPRKAASHSDNADPGVIGPVVWERHKRGLDQGVENDAKNNVAKSTDFSPVRDPAAIRNHYEGILESAIQMYTSQDDLPMPLPTCNFANSQTSMPRENRGSSAGLASYSTRSCDQNIRPATAQPNKLPKSNHSTEPPSPTLGAWSGSLHGSHSPLVRPMSAGPFHRPEPQNSYGSDDARNGGSRERLSSAAPIIEAIQNELHKFKENYAYISEEKL